MNNKSSELNTNLRLRNKRVKVIVICLLLIWCESSLAFSCCINMTVIVLVEQAFPDGPFSINNSIGIIELGMEKAREIVEHSVNLNFVVRHKKIRCVGLEWGALAAELYHTHNVHAIIGPGCSPAVATVSRMAASWNLPHFSYVATAETLGNKTEFSMLTRLSYTLDSFAKFYINVFNTFGWVDIANIYDSSNYLTGLVGRGLQKTFQERGIRSSALPFQGTSSDLRAELLRVLNEAKTLSRVFMVCCNGDIFRQMVLLSSYIGIPVGEFAFIFFYSIPGDPVIGDYSWRRGDELDATAKEAYHSVMIIRPRRPTTEEFIEFEKEIMRRAVDRYGYVWPERSEANIYNIGHYNSFLLYAHALNETLNAGEDPRNGSGVVNRMWNRTFEGIGGLAYVDINGDNDPDFSLLDSDPTTGDWRVAAEYRISSRQFELIRDTPIHWPNNGDPPPNKPLCGFTGELCYTFSLPPYAIVSFIFGALLIIVVAAGTLAFRRAKAEAAIHSQWWKIRWEDINIRTKSSFLSTSFSVHTDDRSLSIATHANTFQTVGVYKGTQVHIQKPNIKSLTVDRRLLMELKQMRDITCQNLTRLIGVCPDVNNVSIITEHCSRGNLQDILQNNSMQLDWDFRISLINDIVQGMYYIHSSPLEVHGRLTSSRCVIDSRFVLKITGFGLKSIKECNISSNRTDEVNTYIIIPELLWMAPEILRKYPPRRATQMGDVYSFAIILYEICTRNEPYIAEEWYSSLEGIQRILQTIEKIKRKMVVPARPSIEYASCFPGLAKLAENCWKDNPDERPSFASIKKTMSSLTRGSSHKNVLDVLLHRMEQYANNLEGLVEERTNAFLEEKKRSEELLYQVLPRSVADQLRIGQTVKPEAYESVSVYFSDIVGFTSISAICTPFQVVDFLNDVYTCFDSIIDHYDVYKVETIGDAYMVVSGLPIRNGNEHVRQIARLSIEILEQVQQFTIRHQPDTPLRARIGIHSGPVCAGVVGRKMPRYCLFGDTVNTASRMESTGEAMMIQISDSTKHLLDIFGNFFTEERGTIKIKGKGSMTTYWLMGEHPSTYMQS